MVVPSSPFKDGSISALSEDAYLIGSAGVTHEHTHPLAAAEGQYLEQFVNSFLLLKYDLYRIFRPLHEGEADSVGEVNEANFVGTGPLILVPVLISHNVMADDEIFPKFLELFIELQMLNILFDVLPRIYSILDSDHLEDHLICSQSSCLIC